MMYSQTTARLPFREFFNVIGWPTALPVRPRATPLVYFATAGDMVRISATTNLTREVARLRAYSPVAVDVVKVVHGGMPFKAMIHRSIDRNEGGRHHGDWFHRDAPGVAVPLKIFVAVETDASECSCAWCDLQMGKELIAHITDADPIAPPAGESRDVGRLWNRFMLHSKIAAGWRVLRRDFPELAATPILGVDSACDEQYMFMFLRAMWSLIPQHKKLSQTPPDDETMWVCASRMAYVAQAFKDAPRATGCEQRP